MKKFLTILFLFIIFNGFSQYYYIPYTHTGQNPGGLNNDMEISILTGSLNGWSTILNDANTAAVWSDTQDIPFPFVFNGNSVSQYKVSNTGVLTFSIGELIVPPYINTALPASKVPDNSICVWGIYMESYSSIITKVFGMAPHRQLWVQFNVFSEDNIRSGVTYWSIILEESTNNIYIVDQSTYCKFGYKLCTDNVKITAGLQFQYPNILQISGSPNLGSLTKSLPSVSDNTYYKFVYGVHPDYDLGLEKVFIKEKVNKGVKCPVKGYVRNCGKAMVTSFDLNYKVGSGTTQTITVYTNLLPGDSCSFTAPDWTPSEAGKYNDITFWTDHINTNQVDMNHSDDTLKKQVFVINGVSGTKRVLIEEATGTWCGYCPDGVLFLNELIIKNNDNLITLANHGGDTMTIVETDSINRTYAMGYPTALIDRYKWDTNEFAYDNRGNWELRFNDRKNAVSPVNISILNPVYNDINKTISFDVKTDFVDFDAGDIRLSCVLSENWVSNPDPAFNQHNYYSKDIGGAGGPNHPLYNYPEWLNASDSGRNWYHQHVTRAYLTDVWGDYLDPNTPNAHVFASGSSFNRHFLINIDPNWNPNQLNIVAFVSYYYENPEKREILNVNEQKATTTGFSVRQNHSSDLRVFPNPVQNTACFEIEIENSTNVSLIVYDLMGKIVIDPENKTYSQGIHQLSFDSTTLPEGIYIIWINAGNKKMTGKFSKINAMK